MTKPQLCVCGHRKGRHYTGWGCEAVGADGACECAEFKDAVSSPTDPTVSESPTEQGERSEQRS